MSQLPRVLDGVDIRRVTSSAEALFCARMTFPAFRSRLLAAENDSRTFAWAAFGERPLGLILAGLDEPRQSAENPSAEILSIFVRPADRNRGLATALLATAERELRSLGVADVRLTYSAGESNTSVPALERLLAAAGWSTPQPHMFLVRIENANHERAFRASWMQTAPWPDGFEVFAWRDLTAADRQYICQRQERDNWYPEIVAPWAEEATLEPLTSVGLRWRGQAAGWMITHRIAPDTIRYSYLFVSPDVPCADAGLRLVGAAVRAQAFSDPAVRYGIFGIHANNRLGRIAQRRLTPYLTVASTTETRLSSKQLK